MTNIGELLSSFSQEPFVASATTTTLIKKKSLLEIVIDDVGRNWASIASEVDRNEKIPYSVKNNLVQVVSS